MFKSSENLRLAAEMRALERVARPWREARRSWFDGTPESIEARLAATERVLTRARSGFTTAHLALTREAAEARRELVEARHRLLTDFLDDGARAFKGSRRVAERGLRECINCGGGLSGEEDDDKESECPNCGMSAHHKGVDWRKKGSHRTAVDTHGYNWPDDFPLPEGTGAIDNGDGTMTCPNCGYDEVKPNTSSTCPECDHYDDNFLDDSDEAVGGFERAMERKYPILPEHGGPESGLWGGKYRRPFESARLAAGFGWHEPGFVPSHGFPITEGDTVHWVSQAGHPHPQGGRVLQYPLMGPDFDYEDDDEAEANEIPYYDMALVDWGDGNVDHAEADEIVPNQHLNEFLRRPRPRRAHRTAANHIGMDWHYEGGGHDDGTRGHDATTEVGDVLQTHPEFPVGRHPKRPNVNIIHTDQPPVGWGYGIWFNEPNGQEGVDWDTFDQTGRDGNLVWQGDNGRTIYPTHDEAKAAAEAHYYSLDHANRRRIRRPGEGGGIDSGVDYDAIINRRDDPGYDDFGDIFGRQAGLFARLAGEGMSYEDTMRHIDEVLAEGEGHKLHHQPGVDHLEPEHSGFHDHSDIFDHCRACGGDGIDDEGHDCEGCDGTGENQGDPYGECEGCGGEFQIEDLDGDPDTGLYCPDCGEACEYCGVGGGNHRHGCPER